MKSLKEKVREGMTEEERCDVLFSMINRIEDGKAIGGSPEEVQLDEDGQIEVVRLGGRLNLLFGPPELIENPRMTIGKEQRWFTLGMHAYYMHYKTDYYTRKNTSVLAPLSARQTVITPADVKEIPYGKSVSALTAIDPKRRVEGLRSFLQYLNEKVKAEAKIRYLCNGVEVGGQTKALTGEIKDLWPGGKLMISKMAYAVKNGPVRIPYRPGTHSYDVEVVPAGQQNGPKVTMALKNYRPQQDPGLYLYYTERNMIKAYIREKPEPQQLLYLGGGDCENQISTYFKEVKLDICRLSGGPPPVVSKPLGHILIEKPHDYQGDAYLINLFYIRRTGCVKVRLTSESGVSIAPERVVSMKSLQ